MFNIINFELKRAFKSASTYLILVIFLILTVVPPLGIYKIITDAKSVEEVMMMGADSREEAAVTVEIGKNGANSETNEPKFTTDKDLVAKAKKEVIKNKYSFQSLFNNFSTSGPMGILFIVFVSIASSKEYSSGFIKNLVTIKNYKYYQPITKVMIGAIYALVMILLALVSYAIVASVLTGNLNMVWNKTFKFIGVAVLAQMTLTALMALIANFTNNSTTTIVSGLLLVFGILRPILSLIDNAQILPFKLSNYSLINVYGGFFTGLETAEFVDKMKEILWLAIPMLVIYIILNIIVLRKKDINLG